jgi:ABC-type transport system involved in multi-copper enzyme maturation permease subunit
MPGISIITKKEISDAVTNKSFLLSFGILVLCMLLAGFAAGNAFNSQRFGSARDRLLILRDIAPNITLLGALVAVALGFNSINKERPEGSLKVMLSYPIYRDQIVLGKLLGNLAIISIATTASTGISLALYLQMTKIVLDSEMLVRYATLTLLAILLLSGYLGLSILLSASIKDPKTTLLVTFLFLGIFNSETLYSYGQMLSNVVYGNIPRVWGLGGSVPVYPPAKVLQDFVSSLSPAYDFTTFSTNLGNYLQPLAVNGVVINSRFWDLITNNLVFLPVLVILPVATFIGCYILFTRTDIS